MQLLVTTKKIFFVFVAVLMVPAMIYSQILQEKNLDRPYEIRFNSCAEIDEFQGVPISEIHLCAYRGIEERWEQIAFQIDELDVVGHPDSADYFAAHNGLVDEKDELVYLVRDAGDQVPVGVWIQNEESKNYSRYEIEVADTTSGKKGWLYLFRTSSMTGEVPPGYMSVNGETGRIQSRYYEAGYDESSILQYFAITEEGGGTGTDLLDRQKYYILGAFGVGLKYFVTENQIKVKSVDFVSGPIRVIRRTANDFWPDSIDEPLLKDLIMTAKFTPYYLQYSSGAINFVEQFGVERVRQTWDFNSDTEGMKFHSTHNRDILVDGIPDVVSDTLEHNQLNWMMVTGDPGTVLAVNDLSFIGNRQRLYFKDDKTNDPNDTGDKKS
ncbi:hypothetical protein KAH55_11750, partial [bacterium]|nr:hypothetical protein [bacterium]